MKLSDQVNLNLIRIRKKEFDTRESPFTEASLDIAKLDYLVDFRRHERGWPLQYYLNRAEPLRARPNIDIVFASCWIKKMMVNLLYDFRDASLFKRLKILLSITTYYNYFIETAHYGANEYIRSVDKLSQAPREFYRVIWKVFGEKLRDIITIILEGDPAYRYRLQDILINVDIDKLKENPIKEILRLIDILMAREKIDGMNEKWRFAKVGLVLVLTINPKLKNKIKDLLLELDLDEIELSKEDLYWCDMYKEYDFGGLTFEQRIKRHREIYGEEQTKFDLKQLGK